MSLSQDPDHQKAILVAILDTAVDAIVVIDRVGIIQSVNAATHRLFGFDESEMVGHNVKMLMPEPYRGEHDQYLSNYHRTGKAKIIGAGREVIGRRKDGTEFPMHLAVSEVIVGEGKWFAGIVRDISDLKAAEESLKRSNEELERRVTRRTNELSAAQANLLKAERLATLGQVSGGIAHEIRNPLNAVRTSSYCLRHETEPIPENRVKHLDRIDRQVAQIESVVKALSDLVRLPMPDTRPCDVDGLLNKVLKSTSIPESVQLNRTKGQSVAAANVDPEQLEIVLGNLLRNAIDAMPDGGDLLISVSQEEKDVMVRISDSGIGMSQEQLNRMTEPLFSTKSRGMGLGMSISATILQKNRCHFTVQSDQGSGTTFVVHLPAHS